MDLPKMDLKLLPDGRFPLPSSSHKSHRDEDLLSVSFLTTPRSCELPRLDRLLGGAWPKSRPVSDSPSLTSRL